MRESCEGFEGDLEAEKTCEVREGDWGRAAGPDMAPCGVTRGRPFARWRVVYFLRGPRSAPAHAPSPLANSSRRQPRALWAGPAPKEPGERNVSQ